MHRRLATLALVVLCGCHQNYANNLPSMASPSTGASAPPSGLALAVSVISAGIQNTAIVDGVVLGPDGRVWFTQTNTAQIGAATTAGSVQQYSLTTPSGYTCIQPEQIIVGPDKNLWAASYCGELVRVTTAGAVTVYPISATASFSALAIGPDANLWLGDELNGVIDVVSVSGNLVRTITLPNGSVPAALSLGADNNIWVADQALGAIDRVTSAGAITSFTMGMPAGAAPRGIIGAPDGNLYFTAPQTQSGSSDQIGRITTSGVVTMLGTLSSAAAPTNLCVGPDKNVWFREDTTGANALGKLTISSGAISEYSLTGIASPNAPDDGAGNGTDYIASSGSNLVLGGTGSVFGVTP